MELKHTIEILTKDIQDIEKLVGNLQNSNDRNTLELDMALSKIRNLYEILTLIREDRFRDMYPDETSTGPSGEVAEKKEQHPAKPRAEAETGPQPEPQTEAKNRPQPEPQTEAKTRPRPEPVAEAETGTQPEPGEKDHTPSKPGTISEKFSSGSSINENMAGLRGKGMDSKLSGQPIDNIGRNIGINDRFLIIRELFDGDVEGYTKLINGLEGAQDYKSAVGLLESSFPGEVEHEGIEILTGLVKRRFSEH